MYYSIRRFLFLYKKKKKLNILYKKELKILKLLFYKIPSV